MRRCLISIPVLLAATVAVGLASASPATATMMPTAAAVPQAEVEIQHSSTLGPYPLRCVVTGSNVNYRRGPGTQYCSYGQVNRGFTFTSDGGVPNPRSRYQYWNNIERPGHADAYVDAAYVYCWLAPGQ